MRELDELEAMASDPTRRFPIPRLRTLLQDGDLHGIRQLHVRHYGGTLRHGASHAFVSSLAFDPYVTYYRKDPFLAARQAAGARPTIIFLPPGIVRSAESFFAYVGCTLEDFLAYVEARIFLVTVGPTRIYLVDGKMPEFTQQLFARLFALPHDVQPVFANVVALAQAHEKRQGRLLAAAGLIEGMETGLVDETYQLRSASISAVPRSYLAERLRAFDLVLPEALHPAMDQLTQEFVKSPTRLELQNLMQTAYVFGLLYETPVNRSRGPASRVSPGDIDEVEGAAHLAASILGQLLEGKERTLAEVEEFRSSIATTNLALTFMSEVDAIIVRGSQRTRFGVPTVIAELAVEKQHETTRALTRDRDLPGIRAERAVEMGSIQEAIARGEPWTQVGDRAARLQEGLRALDDAVLRAGVLRSSIQRTGIGLGAALLDALEVTPAIVADLCMIVYRHASGSGPQAIPRGLLLPVLEVVG